MCLNTVLLYFLKGLLNVMAKSVQDFLDQMTLEEKAALCTGAGPWHTAAIERIGLEQMIVSDGPHGLRLSTDIDSLATGSHPATCFPVAAALSASWNPVLLYEMGEALADEAIALGSDIILGPGINIKRSPLCGRNFEYFSEDPLLAGELAAALINGIQSKGVGTSLKHFAVNNQETRRFTVDAIVDERTLHEIYLAGFEIAVKQAKPWTVMCSYNSVNGAFAANNKHLLTDILREQWGFEGFVMSDWGAVQDLVASIEAGLELEMPGPSPHRTQDVIDAVKAGELDEVVLDWAVARLLNIILRAQETPKGNTTFDVDANHALARRVASECVVMLKNEGDVLPLDGSETLAVIGQAATTPIYQGGGSSHINSTKVDAALEFIKARSEVQYVTGDSSVEVNQAAIDESVAIAKDADVAVLFIALPASIESEGYDRQDLSLTPQQIALIKAVSQANSRTVVILNNGSAVDMRAWIDDVDAVLEAWLPGQAGAGAVTDILYGDVNPSGKLAETFPLKLSDVPSHLNFPGEYDQVRYGEGLYVGYRGFEKTEREPLFPFGFGLSYTQFSYSDLQVSKTEFGVGESLEVHLKVTNTGSRAGQEIVQVYVHDVESTLHRPVKELKGFAKVALEAGETKQVTVTLAERAFSYYNPAYGQWIAEAGAFDILVGTSSADIHLTQRVELTQGTDVHSLLNKNSILKDWMQDPQGAEVVQPILDSVFAHVDNDSLGADMADFFQDLPVTKLLGFNAGQLDRSPDEIVDEMLRKLNN